MSVFPLEIRQRVGAFIGRLGYFPIGIRRRVVDHQIRVAMPEMSDADRRSVASGAYANLGRLAIESATLTGLPREKYLELFHDPVGWEHLEHALAQKRGVIVVTGHLGNWEVGVPYMAARGIPVSPVARSLANPLFDAAIAEMRAASGVNMIGDREMVAQVPRRLAAGHAIVLLADQGAKGISAIFVPFFGRPARTPKGPAVMAVRLKVPCVFAAFPREADGKFRAYFEPLPVEITGDRDRDVEKMVTEYTAQLERYVRKYPDQYLWQHHRWKRRPDGSHEEL